MTYMESEDFFSPEEKAALKTLDTEYPAEAKLLGDSILEWKMMLRRIFEKLKGMLEEFDE